uniref:C2H2-type domain-containing protein n=1 Tax=Oncorhynchus kisutch TaxID=8019 RepID=A0A8C7KRF9_ONCKI
MAAVVSLPIVRLHRLTKDQLSLAAQKNNNKPGRKPTKKNSTTRGRNQSTGKGNNSADSESVCSQVSSAPKWWGRPKGSKNKPKISLQLSSAILRPDEVKQEVGTSYRERPQDRCTSPGYQGRGCPPVLPRWKETPAVGYQPAVQSDCIPVRPRTAASQPEGPPVSVPRLWTEVLLQNHAGVPLPDPHTVLAVLLRLGRPIHDAERPFICPQCGRTFTFKSNLTRHMRFHSDAQPYVCPQCGQGFKISLKYHVRRKHTGEKPYKCSDCDKCFVTSGARNAHMVVHTGEKPYKCMECGISYSQSGNLTQHMRRHTGGETIQML